jgi:hypothetical protein
MGRQSGLRIEAIMVTAARTGRLIWALACAAILVYLVLSETYVGAGVVVCLMIIALILERGRPRGGRAD